MTTLICITLFLITIAFLAKFWNMEHKDKISLRSIFAGLKEVLILIVFSYLASEEYLNDQDDY